MSATITIPVDLTNPGQFFACCGLLELADRLWPGAEGWFEGDAFFASTSTGSLCAITEALRNCSVDNTMTPEQVARLQALSAMSKSDRTAEAGLEDEKKDLESLRRELPIVLKGSLHFLVDWFNDDLAGGKRFKTWAGQQSVLDIARAMHDGCGKTQGIWDDVRRTGLPFNFDSDLGAQGSALDIGFSFDPLAGSDATRIEGTCKPALELLAFIGLQRFRPCELPRQGRFVFTAWRPPLPPSAASTVASGAVTLVGDPQFEFKLLYRTKYLKSFLPAIPYRGDRDE
jgi:CRISPR-associated protein Csb3